MSKDGINLLTEIFKIPKFYYFDVLPALVRCAIMPEKKKGSKKKLK